MLYVLQVKAAMKCIPPAVVGVGVGLFWGFGISACFVSISPPKKQKYVVSLVNFTLILFDYFSLLIVVNT